MNWYFYYFDFLFSIIMCLNFFVYNCFEFCISYIMIEIKEFIMVIINSIYMLTVWLVFVLNIIWYFGVLGKIKNM